MGDKTTAMIDKAESLMKATETFMEKVEKTKLSSAVCLRNAQYGDYGDFDGAKKAIGEGLKGFEFACQKLEGHLLLMETHLKSLSAKIKVKNVLSFFKTQKTLDEAKEAAKKLQKAIDHLERTAIANKAHYLETKKAADAVLKSLAKTN